MSVDHYENFPVASVLCPPALRPAVVAIYWFARTADDIADEGDATAAERHAALARYRAALHRCAQGAPATAADWPQVFEPLRRAIERHALPLPLLLALLDAFEQDIANPAYATRAELMDYCRRSADPVGRLILHLHGIADAAALAASDAVCSALQLINFWQDLSVDLPRGRIYVPGDDAARHGLRCQSLATTPPDARAAALVQDLVDWTRGLMTRGLPLAHAVPGRLGWELRLVMQGGLSVLQKVESLGASAFKRRPRLRYHDAPLLLWRAATMRASAWK